MVSLSAFLARLTEIEQEHPTYRIGGKARDGTCDCMGLVRAAFTRAGGEWRWLHSSNECRSYIRQMHPLTSASQLRPGMIVHKSRDPADVGYSLPARYTGSDRRDYYHVGVCLSASPLIILHCTSPGGVVRDTRLGRWKWWGELVDVDYNGQNTDGGDRVDAWVKTPDGGVLNLRTNNNTRSSIKARIPNGTKLTVLDRSDIVWYRVEYEGVRGWVMAEYLTETEPVGNTGVNTGQSYQPASPPSAVTFAMFQALEKRVASIEQLLYRAGQAAMKEEE